MHCWVGETTAGLFDGGRHALESAWLAEGEGVGAELRLDEDTRAQPWRLDLEREARRLSVCESGAVLLWDVEGKRWKPCAMGCGSKLCPVCTRTRAARACARWRGVLDAASADGAVLRHWTLTQPALAEPGGLVTARELTRGWTGTLAADGVQARAVGGEGLGRAYRRLRETLTAVRDGRRTRARWKEGLGAHLVGCEWTGRGRGGVPRWHAHVHILGCTEAGVEVDVDGMLLDWVLLTGGAVKAQHVRIVDPSAVVEVLKYPFKPAHLTSAQRIETLAYMRGMHPHHPSGAWNRQARASREPPWSTWLDARPDPTEYLRLHHLSEAQGASPELWTGKPSEGLTRFAVRYRGRWRTWEADAAAYASLLGDDPASGGVVPAAEPGSDFGEDWFTT